MVPRRGGFLSHTADAEVLPPWLTETDVDFFAGEFSRAGFRGGLNWYRNIDRSWELLAPFAGARVTVPALYVAGDRDLVVAFRGMDQLIPNLVEVRARSPPDDHAARLRALDPAGAAGRGQRGDDRVPAGLVAAARSGGASAGATSSANRRIDRSARSVRSPGRAITRSTRS